MKNRNRQRGLTRTEVVVAGGCLVLLTLVILPALSSGRDAGKRAVCLANLKTLGAGMRLYAQDHEDKIPCWNWEFDETGWIGDPWTWPSGPTDYQLEKAFELGYIWEYVQTRAAFVCPALRARHNPYLWHPSPLHTTLVFGWPNPEEPDRPSFMWSYSLNGQPGLSMNDPQWRVNPELVQPSPASVMMLFEQDYMDYAAFDNSISLFNPTYDTNSNAEDSLGRYHKVSGLIAQSESTSFNNTRGSGNIVFFDGHVDDMTIEEFIMQRSTSAGTLELIGGYMGFIWPGF